MAAGVPGPAAAAFGLCAGVSAVILIRADARPGEWVAVADLAQHLGCSVAAVRRHCEALATAGQIAVQRLAPAPGDVGWLAGEIDQVRSSAHH